MDVFAALRAANRLSLTTRLMLASGLAMLLGGGSLLLALTATGVAHIQEELEHRADDELAALLPLFANQAMLGDQAGIEQLLAQRVRSFDVESIEWTDPHGAALRRTDATPPHHAPAWFVRWAKVQAPRHQQAVQVGGVSQGTLSLQMSASHSLDHLWDSTYTGSAILAGALAANLLLVFGLLRVGMRPLRALNLGTQRLGAGDHAVRVDVGGPPEMRRTIEVFNHTAGMIERLHGSLRSQQRALEEARDTLESRIAARTAELAHKNLDLQEQIARGNALVADLSASQHRLRMLATLSTDWFWEQDADLCFVQISDGAQDWGGLKRDAHVGKRRWELPYTEIEGGDWAPHRAALEARLPFRDLLLRRTTPGDERWVLVSGAPRFACDDGRFLGYLGVGRDVTQEKRAELALIAARDAAHAASRAKSEFLANMSHEIRTPMNGILGMAGMLLDCDLAARERHFASTVQRSAVALLMVINDILDFSKIEAGKLDLEAVNFELPALLDEVLQAFASAADAKSVDLAGAAAAAVPAWLRGDPGRLRQILCNLIGNAIKFTARGEVVVGVDLAQDSADEVLLRFTVRDTGIGIDCDVHQRIFEPFTQADGSTTRRYGGTGLGLTISRQLVGMMGGEIGVTSQRGVGSTFWFTARMSRSTGRPTPQLGDSPAMARLERTGFTGRVLLAEDNDVNRLVAISMLESLGVQVDVANDGREAVALSARHRYDLVLMDCQMPEMDGFSATAAIRNRDCGAEHSVIVAVTAHAMDGDRERCLALGMDDYLSKPFAREGLARMLGRWLPQRPALEAMTRAGALDGAAS